MMKAPAAPWPCVSLRDVAKLIRGVTFTSDESHTSSGPGTIAVLRAGNIADRLIIDSDLLWIPDGRVAAEQRLRRGDIAICMSSGSAAVVGKTAILEHDWNGCVGAFCAIIRPRDCIEPSYLAAYLRGKEFAQWRRNQAQGANIQNLRASELDLVPIPLPPVDEQRRIAAILQEAEEVRRLCDLAEARAGALAPAIFESLFGAPAEWRGGPTLGDLVKIVGGGTPSRRVERYFTGDIPWATSKDIKQLYLSDTEEHVTEEAVHSSATNVVPAGTLLVVVKSKILAHSLPLAIAGVPMCFGQDIKGLIPNPGIPAEFLVYALQAQVGRILSRARGANTEGLTLESLRSLAMPRTYPDAIARFVAACREIQALGAANLRSSRLYLQTSRSLSAHAFLGHLTTHGRDPLAAEIRYPGSNRRRPGAPSALPSVPASAEPISAEARSDGIHAELAREQQYLLREIKRLFGGEVPGRYFTAEQLAGELFGPLHRHSHALEAHLSVFAVRGLVIPVSRARTEVPGQPFAACYRLPAADTDDVRATTMNRQRKLAAGNP